MKGWTMPVQQASYRGIHFDVFSVDDGLDRSVIEHSYPFVNGADLEDLGLNPLEVRLSAVFLGAGYYSKFKQCLEALKKQGPDVLTHPIRGRLPNMICVSAQFHHDAEYSDYVTLEMTFREATPAKPIFLFENAVLTQIDGLLNSLELFVDDALELFNSAMEYVSFAFNARDRLLRAFEAVYGAYEHIRDLFDFDAALFSLSPHVTTDSFKSQSARGCRDLFRMIEKGLKQVAGRSDLTLRAKFDEVLRMIKKVDDIPDVLLSGKSVQQSYKNQTKSLTSGLTGQDVKAVRCAVQTACSITLMRIAIDFMTQDILPNEIEYLATKVRLQLLKNLNTVREFSQDDTLNSDEKAPNTGLYTKAHVVSEQLRNHGHNIMQLALAAINRKPPLIIREVEINGTLQQIAHQFYQDYRRADELLRLNEHIRYPNFIKRGEVLNSYAR